jgi:hypothetical protein
MGDAIYLQISGWKGCLRGADWRADEEVERAYCDELGLKFEEGREGFTGLGRLELSFRNFGPTCPAMIII